MDGISSAASSVSFDLVGDEQIGNEDLSDVGDDSGDDVSTDREDNFAQHNVDKLASRIATAVVKKLEKLNTVIKPHSNASGAIDKLLLMQPKNVWNVADCHQNLFVLQPNCLIVRSIERNIRSSVRAELMIPRHFCGIFYFEVQVNKMFGSTGVAVGLAPKSMPLDGDCVGILKNSYSYECNGAFWGHHVHGCGHYKNSPCVCKDTNKFGAGDIVGCGVNLANRQVIYTKNGARLDTANLFVYQTDLYPCVSLQNPGDSIVANFGPDFEYDVAKEYFPDAATNTKTKKKKHLFTFERQKLLLVCPRNRLNAKDSSSDLCVIRPDCVTVYRHGKGTRSDVCSVRAELMIPRHHCGVFYYEVKIVKLDRWILVGLAEKSTPLDYEGIVHTYGYTSIGEFWGHSVHGCEYYKNVPLMKRKDEFGVGDIVGCGLNLATRQIIYTKNGKLLDTTDLLVHQSDLYPYITLKNVADKVTANFGPQFEYNIPEEYLRSEE